jgi:AcrR family transcriptional regulator
MSDPKLAATKSKLAVTSKARAPMRADALRNRTRILQAAQEAFTEEGKLVPLDEIARRAGVGAGTVYRHFPTKEALFEAVFLSRVENLANRARAMVSDTNPERAFFDFLAHMVAESWAKRDLVDAMSGAGIDVTSPDSPASRELRSAITELLVRAQAVGAVRKDVATADIMAMVAGMIIAAQRRSADPTLHDRVFTVFRDGLRPPA